MIYRRLLSNLTTHQKVVIFLIYLKIWCVGLFMPNFNSTWWTFKRDFKLLWIKANKKLSNHSSANFLVLSFQKVRLSPILFPQHVNWDLLISANWCLSKTRCSAWCLLFHLFSRMKTPISISKEGVGLTKGRKKHHLALLSPNFSSWHSLHHRVTAHTWTCGGGY